MVFVNDDHYLCPDWDAYLNDELEQMTTDYFYLSMTVIEPRGENPNILIRNFGETATTFDQNRCDKECQQVAKPDWTGATSIPSLVPFILWDLVGGYSIEFSPGSDSDPEFSRKLWECGVRYFKCIGKSRVYHFSSVSAKKNNKGINYFKQQIKDHHLFARKWGMPSKMFTKIFLKYGTPWTGPLAEPVLQLSERWELGKYVLKRHGSWLVGYLLILSLLLSFLMSMRY
jgi:hypothetical protein